MKMSGLFKPYKDDTQHRTQRYQIFEPDDKVVDAAVEYLKASYGDTFIDFQLKHEFKKSRGITSTRWQAIAKPKAFGLDDVVGSHIELPIALILLDNKLAKWEAPEQVLSVGMFA